MGAENACTFVRELDFPVSGLAFDTEFSDE
jgi:hypothetical protein